MQRFIAYLGQVVPSRGYAAISRDLGDVTRRMRCGVNAFHFSVEVCRFELFFTFESWFCFLLEVLDRRVF